MAERTRRNAPPPQEGRRRRGAGAVSTEGIRRRLRAEPELELSEEELQALADEGLDPEDLRRIARDRATDDLEASDHDRDTPRDELEGLAGELEGEQ